MKQVIREGIFTVLGQGANALVAIASVRLITEAAPTEVYGLASLILSGLAILIGLVVRPIVEAFLRFEPVARSGSWLSELKRSIEFSLVVVVSGICVVFVILGLIGPGFTSPIQGVVLGAGCTAWFIGSTGMAYYLAYLNARRRQGILALVKVGETLSRMGLVLAGLVLIDKTVGVYLWGEALGLGLILVVALVCARTVQAPQETSVETGSSKRGAPADLQRRLLTYAVPLIPLAVLHWLLGVGDRYIISFHHGNNEVGIYAAAYGLSSKPFLMLSAALLLFFRPYMFDEEFAGRRLWLSMIWSGVILGVGITGVGGLYLFDDEIAGWLLAEDYRRGAELFPIIGGAYLLYAMVQAGQHLLLAGERSRAVVVAAIMATVVGLGGAFWLVPSEGALGAAWATMMGMGVYFVVTVLELLHDDGKWRRERRNRREEVT